MFQHGIRVRGCATSGAYLACLVLLSMTWMTPTATAQRSRVDRTGGNEARPAQAIRRGGNPRVSYGRPENERSGRGGLVAAHQPQVFLTSFKLEVRRVQGQVIGDIAVNEDWVSAMKTASRSILWFRYQTLHPGATTVEWQVSKTPFSKFDPAGNKSKLVGKGLVGAVPAKGETALFAINFQHLLPAKPDKSTYYVRLVGRNGQGKYLGASSTSVAITYEPIAITHFTSEGLGLTTKQKHAHMYNNSPMPIQIDLEELYIGNENEGGDEPYLFVLVCYVDGTTINPLSLPSSTIRIDCPSKTHGNVPDHDVYGNDVDTARTVRIPAKTGHFESTIEPIGLDFAADLEDCDGSLGDAMQDGTAVYILVVAMEEDGTSTSAVDAARSAVLTAIQDKANKIVQQLTLKDLRAGKIPGFDPQEIQKQLQSKAFDAAKSETLSGPWFLPQIFPVVLAQILDPDDYIGWSLKQFTFRDVLEAGPHGIYFQMSLANPSDFEGAYTVRGRIRRK
jgi:hypothetical protein